MRFLKKKISNTKHYQSHLESKFTFITRSTAISLVLFSLVACVADNEETPNNGETTGNPTPAPVITPIPTVTEPPIVEPPVVEPPAVEPPVVEPPVVEPPVVEPAINLALGKQATQSSIDYNGIASRAIDGNTDGDYWHYSITHTEVEDQPWWQVDLEAVQFISHINIFNRVDCCTERLSNFYVLVSDNAFDSTVLENSLNQDGVTSYYVDPTVDGSISLNIRQTARYVRVQLSGSNNPLSLAEVEVFSGEEVVVSPTPAPVATPTPDPELVALYQSGAQIWAATCQSCHGQLDVTLKRERTRQQIVNSLNIPAMRNITLSDTELDALTYALNNSDPNEAVIEVPELSGADIFAQQCASCHTEGVTPYYPLYVKRTDLDSIENYTISTMPLTNPQSCIGECATKVAEYLISIAPEESGNGGNTEVEPLLTERLKRDHYYQTLDYLLNPYGLSTAALSHPEDPVNNGFGNGSLVDSTLVFSYHTNAVTLAQAFVEKVEDDSQIIGCNNMSNTCARDFYLDFAEKAYRRPLIQDQIERLDDVYNAGGDPLLGLGNFMGFVLQSPAMLYYLDPIDDDSDYTLANQLSYLLLNEPPDAELLLLADQNALRDRGEYTAQVDRLLNSPKGQQTLVSFVSEWLSLNRVQAIVKDEDTAPGFDRGVLDTLESDLLDFVNTSLSQDKSLEYLFSGNHSLSNDVVNALSEYGNNVNTTRQGILSQPGVLAFLAGPEERSPIIRGAYILDKLLCDHRTPVDGIDSLVANIEIPEDASPRERTTLLTAAPVCQSCHVSINSLGFGLENYNGLGLPISESQTESFPLEVGTPTTLSFNGVESLQTSLLGTDQLYDCTAENASAYASTFVSLNRIQEEIIQESFKNSASLQELFKSIALVMLENN